MLADATDDRHPRRAVLAQGRRVRIEPGGEPHVAPEQLDHAAATAPQVEHPARRRDVAADDRLELVSARSPVRPDRPVALAVRILNCKREDRSPPDTANGRVLSPRPT